MIIHQLDELYGGYYFRNLVRYKHLKLLIGVLFCLELEKVSITNLLLSCHAYSIHILRIHDLQGGYIIPAFIQQSGKQILKNPISHKIFHRERTHFLPRMADGSLAV
ncbi:hypothetical protein IC582_022977 [Cucumis melo]